MTELSHDGGPGLEPGATGISGVVVDEGRGTLPYALVHGESLLAAATWALDGAGIRVLGVLGSLTTPQVWSQLQAAIAADAADAADADEPEAGGAALVLHDCLCPLVSVADLTACVVEALEADTIVVGIRPVTDTVKVVRDGLLGETLDRDALAAVASPIVLPASVVAALERLPSADFAALVTVLQAQWPVRLHEVGPEGRRVADADEVQVLESLSRP